MSVSHEALVNHIETLALNTWPPSNQVPLGDWFLRASEGITKRANSIWTSSGTMPSNPQWYEAAEQFYRTLGLPLRFQISDATSPELAALLDAKRYAIEVPSSVMTASTREALRLTENMHGLCTAHFQPNHDDDWLTQFMMMEGHGNDPAKKQFYNALFQRIQPPACFVTLYLNRQPVAVGTAVAEEGWAGFLNVVVHRDYRGQGIGKELVHQLASWSDGQHADHLYLQVIDDNEPAWKLYRKAGFTPLYTYHYRIQPSANDLEQEE